MAKNGHEAGGDAAMVHATRKLPGRKAAKIEFDLKVTSKCGKYALVWSKDAGKWEATGPDNKFLGRRRNIAALVAVVNGEQPSW